VCFDDDGEVMIDDVIKGDTVREVLAYVQYSAEELTARLRKDVEKAVRTGRISLTESRQMLRFYETGLDGYTYLEEP
jgi:arginine decarboxylase